MARGFIKGILFGGLMGAVIGIFTAPQLKPARKMRVIMGTGKKITRNMSRIYKDVRGGIKDITD